MAERLGFSAKRQRTPVGDLSGGERRRLQLTRVLMAEPNVLLLDEPTNDLDIDTLQELESLLDGWPGTLVVISHDRYLIERICDSTWALFGDGKLTNLPRGIEQYLERRTELARAAGKNDNVLDLGEGRGGSTGTTADSFSDAKGSPAPRLSSQEERQLRKDMNAIERKMAKLDDKIADLHRQMEAAAAEASSGNIDTEKLSALDAELQVAQGEHEELEMQWLELGEQLEG